jgi:adenosylhomocysteine nucleosidase
MTYTLIVFAMVEEKDSFLTTLPPLTKVEKINDRLSTTTLKDKNILLLQTGVTMLTSFHLSRVFENYSVDEVINIGTCAGLRNLSIGEVIHTRCFYNDDLDLSMFGRTKGHLVKVSEGYHQHPVLVSGSTFLASKTDVERVIKTFDADAFDMESFGYYVVCENYNIPFSAIRGVTDDGAVHADMSFEDNLIKASLNASLFALRYLKLI